MGYFLKSPNLINNYAPISIKKVVEMPKIELLKDIQIKKTKPQEKEYFLNDGGELRLLVKENGSKIWQFKYTFLNQNVYLF